MLEVQFGLGVGAGAVASGWYRYVTVALYDPSDPRLPSVSLCLHLQFFFIYVVKQLLFVLAETNGRLSVLRATGVLSFHG